MRRTLASTDKLCDGGDDDEDALCWLFIVDRAAELAGRGRTVVSGLGSTNILHSRNTTVSDCINRLAGHHLIHRLRIRDSRL